MSLVSIRDLSRNPSAAVDEVERSGRPALVTRDGKPIAALVRIEQDKLEDWLLSPVADPPIRVSSKSHPKRYVPRRVRSRTASVRSRA